jgi:hypothetical protein
MYVWIVKITRSDAAALSQLLGTPDDNSDDVARAIAWELGMQADVPAEVRDQVWSDGAELVLGAGAFRFAIALAANEKHHASGLPLHFSLWISVVSARMVKVVEHYAGPDAG